MMARPGLPRSVLRPGSYPAPVPIPAIVPDTIGTSSRPQLPMLTRSKADQGKD